MSSRPWQGAALQRHRHEASFQDIEHGISPEKQCRLQSRSLHGTTVKMTVEDAQRECARTRRGQGDARCGAASVDDAFSRGAGAVPWSETASEVQRTQVDSASASWREAHSIAVAARRGVQSFPLQDPQARQTRRLALQGWGDIIKI